MPVQPLDDAACECAGLGFFAGQPTIKLGNAGAFVEVHLPVLGRPAIPAGPQQRHDLGLVLRQCVDNGSRRDRECLQNEVVPVDLKSDAGGASFSQRLRRPHNLALQPVFSSADLGR